jgi:hypothetical protein
MAGSLNSGRAWARITLFAALAATTALFGLGTPAQADTRLSIGVGVGAPYHFHGRPYWNRPYWGPRPYWYGARWYRPYTYWGPSFNFYAWYPATVVETWPEPVRVYQRDAFSAALAGPLGESYGWDSGPSYGSVTAVRDGHSGEKYCREFRQEVSIDGRMEQAYGAACREPDGTWRIVPNNP